MSNATRSSASVSTPILTSNTARTASTTSTLTPSPLTKDFLNFLRNSPSQFHVVASAVQRLETAGFTRIQETADWNDVVRAGGKYFFTRNQSTLIAFTAPVDYDSASATGHRALIIAGHTDSPVLKVKPLSRLSKSGYLQVAVEPYGGGLWFTWFDRDLSLAGRVVVRDGDRYGVRLVHIARPILRVPNLAIHLNREVNDKGFAPNKQTHLLPIIATTVQTIMNDAITAANAAATGNSDANAIAVSEFQSQHHPLLLSLLADQLGCNVADIVDFELSLFDTHEATLGGAHNEFVFSRALDNQCMSFIALRSLIDHSLEQNDSSVLRMIALFDNEEVGSDSFQGAGSVLLSSTLQRLNANPRSYHSALRRSLLISADMAHGVHPNYSEAHEELHRPAIHGGLVIKENANQRYATSALTAFTLRHIAQKHGIALQNFVVRNDSACGSTIGPILATNVGIRTVDVGVAQLSMHSIREMCGVIDVQNAYELFKHAFAEFADADDAVAVD